MQDDNQPQEDNNLQFSSLTFFDQDPLSPDISLLEPEIEINQYQPYLLREEELLSDIHYKINMQMDYQKAKGSYELIITSYRLIFFQLKPSNQEFLTKKQKMPISLPYGFIEEVDLIKKEIVICAKAGIMYRIKPIADLKNIYQTILYGFTYLPFFTKLNWQKDQTQYYDCLAELQRMRFPWQKYIIIPNQSGILSSTYPKYFVISKNITQPLLEECIKIRNHGRVPVLTYYHCDYNSGIWRAARPKINQQNNKFNKAYLKQISKELITIDLRDEEGLFKEKQTKDGGFIRKFESLTSLHQLFRKILILYAKNESILKYIGRWYEDVSLLINTSYFVIENLKLGNQVLLQQQSGFDRVTQVAALSQLIVDPFYRTIHGFSLLIQKEFMSFGHPFARRLGFQREKIAESSPVFIQFLQCVNQLLISHPKCFQFSSFYLARIAYEAYSTKYNNFFYNTQKERLNSKYNSKTLSIWRMAMRKEYYNYQWIEKQAIQSLIAIRRPPSVKQFLIWRQYYDLITQMASQNPDEINVKQRKNSLYRSMHQANSRQ